MTNTYEPAENYAELEPEVEEAADQPDARPVSSQPHDWTISTLRDKYERGQIDLQPHYQRYEAIAYHFHLTGAGARGSLHCFSCCG
jgi:hypothetical protein